MIKRSRLIKQFIGKMSSQIYTFVYIATICNLAIYMPDFALQNINNIPHCLCFIYFHFLSFMPGKFCIVLQIEVCTCKLENCKKKNSTILK